MFFPEGQVRVFLYGQPVNMRLSFDGRYALTTRVMHQDPLSGHTRAVPKREKALGLSKRDNRIQVIKCIMK
jgi:transposase